MECILKKLKSREIKIISFFRLKYARKDSRVHTIEDQFHYLLITRDPVISTLIISDDKNKAKIIKLEEKVGLVDQLTVCKPV